MENQSLASLDIKSLYTNILAKKYIKRFEIHHRKTRIALPLSLHKRTRICILYINISFLLTTVFLQTKLWFIYEFLLLGYLHSFSINFYNLIPFKFIISKDFNYFRYIDNILLLYSSNNDLTKITNRFKQY